jgi:hypothetical protein
MRIIYTIILFFGFLVPATAHAYVGPGLGLGALGVILGIISSILLAIVGIFWYPIKRFIRKLRKAKEQKND